MRIYTRTGDEGETGLYGGQRVGKDDVRVEAYGAVDEANAVLGIAATNLTHDAELHELILRLQSELFTVGADLATPLEREAKAGKSLVPRVEATHTKALEDLIDCYEAELPPLTNFILPGGNARRRVVASRPHRRPPRRAPRRHPASRRPRRREPGSPCATSTASLISFSSSPVPLITGQTSKI